MNQAYPFTLQNLPYSYDALSPVLGPDTLHFHHDKHMQAYVDNLNKALEPCTDFQALSLEVLLTRQNELPLSAQTAVRNNGGGVYNHQLYFSTLNAPDAGTKPSAALQTAIDRDFGNLESMLGELKKAALGRFGSGWAYVAADAQGLLSICSTANQDVPNLNQFVPLMTIDVWEHAYYLDYQNRRPDYVDAILRLINWTEVSRRYEALHPLG